MYVCMYTYIYIYNYICCCCCVFDIDGLQRDPNPEDTSLIRKDISMYNKGAHCTFAELFLIKDSSLGLGTLCAWHPCAGATLIFSVSLQFLRMIPEGNPC